MFQQVNPASMPGIGTSTYARGRSIWAGLAGVRYLPIGGIIAAQLARDPDNIEAYGNETEPVQQAPTASFVIGVTITNAGLGYGSTPPTVTFGAPTSGTTATGVVVLTGAGAVAGVTITNPGSGYTAAPAITFGSGAAAATAIIGNPNVVQPPNCTTSYTGILRAGLLMGKIYAGNPYAGLYRPSIIGVTTATTAGGATSFTTTPQGAVEINRLYALNSSVALNLVGEDAASPTTVQITSVATITAVNTSTGVVTCTVGTVNNGPLKAGAFIVPNDGSQTPITFVDEQFGLNMVDALGNSLSMNVATGVAAAYGAPFPRIPVGGGVINVSNIVNYPGSTKLQSWIKSCLQSAGAVGSASTGTSGAAETAGSSITVGSGGEFAFSDSF